MVKGFRSQTHAAVATGELVQAIRAELGDEVERLDVEEGIDSDGEPALWVWIVLRSDAPETAWAWDRRRTMKAAVSKGLQEAGVGDWIYVRFRDASEEVTEAR